MSNLPERLRRTTQQMASQCSVPMDLWNDHSNACLDAANEIERLQESIRALQKTVDSVIRAATPRRGVKP